jgi:hypothetical protein
MGLLNTFGIGRLGDLRAALNLPCIEIDLMLRAAADSPFYGRITREFYATSRARHGKFPLIRSLTVGVAVCPMSASRAEYFMAIEATGRRNVKKADRLGYKFERIDFNRYLADIAEIRRSTDTRQGALPQEFLSAEVAPCRNPPAKTHLHDYPYFGVLKDGKLYAYMGVLIAGELAMIEHIYGHAAYQSDGVVPKMIVDTAGYLMECHPAVKYYGYGSYFGASATLRRFKKKFGFMPCRVKWLLGKKGGA